MHDIQMIRSNPADFDTTLGRRGLAPASAAILAVDERRRALQTELQALQQRRNEASKAIGMAKSRGEGAEALVAEVGALKDRMPVLEEQERMAAEELQGLLAALPNLPAPEVPDGPDETANVERHRIGEPRRFDFKPKTHDELGIGLGLMDFDSAAKLSGARFVVLKGALARLERALATFMLDLHTQELGYTEINPPLMVRDAAAFGTGNLPKFADDLFRTTNDYWLIPTAEMPLTNLVADRILDEGELPLRFTAYTPCFRSEAGAAGRDTRGMIRQHQFTKVELVSITTAEASEAEHDRMLNAAETVLKRLDLPFRTMTLSAGDMGFAARKTYDIEVWLPGQGAYREISSCSNCGDFQARRMKARYRSATAKQPLFLHTLNGSGLAVGRTMVAVMETYQQANGTITVPPPLRPYMNGLEAIVG